MPDPLVTSPSSVMSAELSSAQILALYDTPVELIPAPGPGKVILLQYEAFSVFTFNTTPYTAPSSALFVNYEGRGSATNLLSAGLGLPAEDAVLLLQQGAVSVPLSECENKACVVAMSFANPTDGDGTLTIMLTYHIIDLAP
jgi:hypothetical protein